jgi:hypothetical protein
MPTPFGMRLSRFLVVLAACALMGQHHAALAQPTPLVQPVPPEIWFGPLTWEISKTTHRIDYSQHDFPAMLADDALWQKAASRTSVVGLPSNVVWSYPDRPALVRFFATHHFKTAFAFGMLFNDGECTTGIEGVSQDHDYNHEAVVIAKLWKEAGGQLDYVLMDGPLAFGHFEVPKCAHSIADVARRSAATLNGIRSHFPTVQVVDAEGPGRLPDGQWLQMMDEWFIEFNHATGQPIYAVMLDLHWTDRRPNASWQNTTRSAAAFFRSRNVRTGLAVNDEHHGDQITDADWIVKNRERLAEIVRDGGLGLDIIFVHNWMSHPQNNVPETDPLAYSSLVNYTFDLLNGK